jgi:hypothetical protein
VGSFFEVVGMVTFVFVTCGFVAVLALLWFIRKNVLAFFQGISQDGLGIQPRRIHLNPAAAPEWLAPERVAAAGSELSRSGFEDAGCFEVEELDGLRIAAWVHPQRRLMAVVYDHDAAGVFCDVVARFAGGGSVTLSSASEDSRLDEMPGHRKCFRAAVTPDRLLNAVAAEVEQRPLRSVARHDFVREFESAYAQEIDWRNARGGPSEAEVQRIAQQLEGDVGQKEIESLRQRLQQVAAEQLSESCLDEYMDQTELSVADWEKLRDSVSVVHDGLDSEQVIEAFMAHVDLPEDLAQDLSDLEPTGTAARDFFGHLNSRIDPRQAYRLIGRVAEPAEADVYALG